jgi:hypothetical protein
MDGAYLLGELAKPPEKVSCFPNSPPKGIS